MENLRYEIYIEDNPGNDARMDIFSHAKGEWIFNKSVPVNEVFLHLDRLMIKPPVSLVHISDNHLLYGVFRATKWETKYFNGLSGKYETQDDSVYEVTYEIPRKPPKSRRQLTAKRIKSTVQGAYSEPFPIKEEQIEKGLRFQTWKKITDESTTT